MWTTLVAMPEREGCEVNNLARLTKSDAGRIPLAATTITVTSTVTAKHNNGVSGKSSPNPYSKKDDVNTMTHEAVATSFDLMERTVDARQWPAGEGTVNGHRDTVAG
ncbi:MAG TPA: hypothetical protein VL171_15200 [Verrucomicrobiae bacterium]|nr:hypothetical protein [Verrucomicrobiae bacterium]